MRSIKRYLLAWIMGALALGSVLVVLVTYLVTLEEMNEVFDANLKSVAEAVASHHHGPKIAGDAQGLPPAPLANEYEIITVTWTPNGERVFSSDSRVELSFSDREGLARQRVEAEEWIVYTRVRPDGVAQAAQRVFARQYMASESAGKVIPPLLGLAVVVGGFLVFGLRRGLQPLDSTAVGIAARSATSLEPIETRHVPREITPLVLSINALMARLATSFAAQRRFLADAAHELRSPVTALRLQLQLLKRSGGEAARQEALSEFESGIARSERLIEQLLQVARSEPDGEAIRRDEVDLGELVRSVVSAASVRAEHCDIDLGANAAAGVKVRGDGNQLTVLLSNLVENALHYGPRGGVVDVEAVVEGGRPMLRVVDNGPGIPELERERVFDRFYRGEEASARAHDAAGSGLGLAIVKAIATRHGAVVSLQVPASGQGLEVRVAFGVGEGAAA